MVFALLLLHCRFYWDDCVSLGKKSAPVGSHFVAVVDARYVLDNQICLTPVGEVVDPVWSLEAWWLVPAGFGVDVGTYLEIGHFWVGGICRGGFWGG